MPQVTLPITSNGALLSFFVGVSQPREQILTASQQPVPQPIAVQGIIDTGASCTCIDPSVLSSLGLSPTGTVPMHTPSTGSVPQVTNQYDVRVILTFGTMHLNLSSIPVIESQLLGQSSPIHIIHALVGRDILSMGVLIYNGVTNSYTFTI